jgi:hypothetical protein
MTSRPTARRTVLARLNGVGRSYLRVVRTPAYFPLWLGQLVSNLGDTLNYVAIVVLVFGLTGSGLAVSTVVVFEIVTTLVCRPPPGGRGAGGCPWRPNEGRRVPS